MKTTHSERMKARENCMHYHDNMCLITDKRSKMPCFCIAWLKDQKTQKTLRDKSE